MQTLCHVFLISTMALSVPAMSAQAQTTVNATIVETDPKAESVLHANEPLSLRITYQSDIPLRFQAAGYSSGVEVQKFVAMNTAPSYPAGSGEAIAWLSYGKETSIDEIRIKIWDKHWKQLDTLSLPITMKWNGITPQAWRQPAPWVTQLNTALQNMTRQAISASSQGGGEMLVVLMAWSAPLYFCLQIYMLRQYQGGWRKAAVVPLPVAVPLFAYTVYAYIGGSNLFWLMMLFITPVLSLYLIGVLVCRFFLHRASAQVRGSE